MHQIFFAIPTKSFWISTVTKFSLFWQQEKKVMKRFYNHHTQDIELCLVDQIIFLKLRIRKNIYPDLEGQNATKLYEEVTWLVEHSLAILKRC